MGILSKYGVHSTYLTPSMHILSQETGSNDIVLLKGDGTEIARHHGTPSSDITSLDQIVESYRRNAFINNVHSKVVWFKGGGSLAVVNLKDFSYTEFTNAIPEIKGQVESVAMRAVHSEECDKIAYTFSTDGVSCIGILTPAQSDPHVYIVSDMISNSSIILIYSKKYRYTRYIY